MICCFIGHRKVEDTESLTERVERQVRLLKKSGVSEFLFGDHSEFCDICYDAVTRMCKEYSGISRVHFSTQSKNQSESVMRFFVSGYEKTFFAEDYSGERAKRAKYILRDRAMIDMSDICVFYYSSEYVPKKEQNKSVINTEKPQKSGTKLSFEYATRKNKKIINLYE